MIDARGFVTNPQGNGAMGPVVGFAIHHSVTEMGAAATEEQELAHVRTIDLFHVKQGFGGFGYHLCAFGSGRSYFCGDLNRRRAHVESRNHELIGICAIGNFVGRLPEAAQLHALQECIDFARQTYGNLPIKGHNDWALPGGGTACAGALNGYQWGTPLPPVPPAVDPVRLSHALPFLYAAYFKGDKGLLHPFDREEIQKAIDWHRS